MGGKQRYERQNYNRKGEILGTKIMKVGVGHMIGKTEAITEGTIEVLVIVGLGQVQEQVQIEKGLDVSSAENMIISQETVQQHKLTER